ncbi:MAG: hypothetical protein RLY31_3174 [Bacteroidota bacterium]|jgi:hypothetical protein
MCRFLLVVLFLAIRLTTGYAAGTPGFYADGQVFRPGTAPCLTPLPGGDILCGFDEETEEEDGSGERRRFAFSPHRADIYGLLPSYRNELHLLKLSLSLHTYYCLFRN